MTRYTYDFKSDYDKRVKVEDRYVFCYSPKKMKELYPQGYMLVGETPAKSNTIPNKVKANSRPHPRIGGLYLKSETVSIYQNGCSNKLMNKLEGYICVGENQFIAVYKSRVPFVLTLFSMLAVLAICILLLLLLTKKDDPLVIKPDHPLPDEDSGVVEIPDDNDKPTDSVQGGGAVTMIYTLAATVDLSSGDVGIYLRNPKKSNHDVTITMYIVSGGNEYLIAKSGLIKAGYGLYKLTLSEDAPTLTEGVYTAYYKIGYYNPETGERALVEADIKDVTVTVTE